MATKVQLGLTGAVENMFGFTTPGGDRYPICGNGGGQELAHELDLPLFGKVPITMRLREQAEAGIQVVVQDPNDPAAQAIRHIGRGIIAATPELSPMQNEPKGASLPMA